MFFCTYRNQPVCPYVGMSVCAQNIGDLQGPKQEKVNYRHKEGVDESCRCEWGGRVREGVSPSCCAGGGGPSPRIYRYSR